MTVCCLLDSSWCTLVCSRITVLAFDDALAPLPAMATCFLFGFVCRYGIFSYVLFI
ncbi:hypothetical protein NC653_022985 [Populus alba x Populus x berolinensis]|uniref:Uncharacterized protein n=1 Tax=Populus alba x Populus x berolinensis TaxID=444605 RepID=A0AAD6MG37_9ROSI|nr:hypothetical protein NC653_022985 [Populus alba x Populus x berolinensis]